MFTYHDVQGEDVRAYRGIMTMVPVEYQLPLPHTRDWEHDWQPSHILLGLVGSFWRYVYPWACKCGALKNVDGVISGGKRTGHGESKS